MWRISKVGRFLLGTLTLQILAKFSPSCSVPKLFFKFGVRRALVDIVLSHRVNTLLALNSQFVVDKRWAYLTVLADSWHRTLPFPCQRKHLLDCNSANLHLIESWSVDFRGRNVLDLIICSYDLARSEWKLLHMLSSSVSARLVLIETVCNHTLVVLGNNPGWTYSFNNLHLDTFKEFYPLPCRAGMLFKLYWR